MRLTRISKVTTASFLVVSFIIFSPFALAGFCDDVVNNKFVGASGTQYSKNCEYKRAGKHWQTTDAKRFKEREWNAGVKRWAALNNQNNPRRAERYFYVESKKISYNKDNNRTYFNFKAGWRPRNQ